MQAVTVVRHLLRGREDDSCVLDDLAELLAAEPDEDIALLSQGSCTGVRAQQASAKPVCTVFDCALHLLPCLQTSENEST
jgi:hypothetical protein